MRKKEEVGNRHGKLTVIEWAGSNKNGKALWKCVCDCGNIKIIVGSSLRRNKNTKSCGCLIIERIKEVNSISFGQASFNTLYGNYQKAAKRRGLSFGLTKEDFSFLTQMNCHYCGREPKQVVKKKSQNGAYIYTGIDRVDNTKGYTMDNVVPCCVTCNRMKRDMTVLEFLSHIREIVRYRGEDLHDDE